VLWGDLSLGLSNVAGLAMFATIRRASSRVSNSVADLRPDSV
jgi:hypothetical protein